MKVQDITSGFQKVDDAQTEFLVKFLEKISQFQFHQESFKEQLDWLKIEEGQHVLDIGCGIGDQAYEIAKKAGSTGKVIGTDLSETMVRISKQRHADSGLSLSFEVADASEQPFPDEMFDSIRTERVLMYLPDNNKTFKEYNRLLKPKGKLLIFDVDWDSFSVAHSNRPLTRKICTYVSDSFPSGRIGAELPEYFNSFGFENVKFKRSAFQHPLEFSRIALDGILNTGVAKGVFTESEIKEWWKHLEERNQRGTQIGSVTGYLVMGTKIA